MGNMITTLHRCVQVFPKAPRKLSGTRPNVCGKSRNKGFSDRTGNTARETSCTAYSRKKWMSASLRTSWPRDSVEGCSAPITSR